MRAGRSGGSAVCGDSLADLAISLMFSCLECDLWLVNSIVRFWGIIAGKVGWAYLRDLWFILLGLAALLEFGARQGESPGPGRPPANALQTAGWSADSLRDQVRS